MIHERCAANKLFTPKRPTSKTMGVYWFVVLVISMAVHLTNANSAPSHSIFVSLHTTSFVQGRMLATIEPRDQSSTFKIEHNEDCPEDVFEIGSTDGQLSLLRALDFNNNPQCRTNGQGDNLISVQTFYCTVIESNSYGISVVINVIPVIGSTDQLTFPETFYRGSVVEGVENATVIMSSDNDTPLTAHTQPVSGLVSPDYRIIGEYDNQFRVISHRVSCQTYPIIIASQALRRADRSQYEISLEAFTDLHSATTTVMVEVLDTNDQSPQFTNPQNTLTISESTTLGMGVTQYTAMDGDSGLNSEIRFSISTNQTSFTIHPLTGYLSLYAPLDFEERESIEVAITATDLGDPSLTAQTTVMTFTSNANELPPQIIVENLEQLNISENAPLGTEVTTISVADPDSTTITVTLQNVKPDNYFRIEGGSTPNQYRIVVNSALDFESVLNGQYIIILRAEDDGGLSTEMRVEITINDENEPPYFDRSTYETEVREGVPLETVVFQLHATDPDTSTANELTYSITSTDPPLFDVHGESGSIYTTSAIDYELLSVTLFTFNVAVSDRHQPELSATAMLMVHILDENDNAPVFVEPKANITIMESHDADVPVHLFSATDQDSECNGAVQYSILHSEPANVFQINPSSGYLYLAGDTVLNVNEFGSAVVVIRATDLGDRWTHFTECTLYVTINAANTNAPVLEPIRCPCFIQEELPLGEECFPLTAHDPDSSDLEFRIASGNDLMNFMMDSTTGIVQSTRTLDRETQSEYNLEIVVFDGFFTSEPQTLNIKIVDINDNNPVYSSTVRDITAPTDLTAGDYIGSAAATDRDIGFNALINHQFTPSTPSSVTNEIRLDPLSGELFAKQALSTNHEFSVIATSLIQPSQQSSAFIRITLSGLKNNPPYFAVSTEHYSVASELALNSIVATVSAQDDDSGINGDLSYALVPDSGNHSDLFTISNMGVITSVGSLSAMVGNAFSMNVSVTDGGAPSYTVYQEVIIVVYESQAQVGGSLLVYNPSVPPCHYMGEVQELVMFGGINVATISTAQGAQTAVLTLIESEFSSAFTLENFPAEQEAILSTVAGFENIAFTGRKAIFLQVRATYGSNFHICSLTVLIEDINNHVPRFAQETYSFEVYDSTPIGSSVFQLSATDDDIGTNAEPKEYRMEPSTTPFTIDSLTGRVELSSSLQSSSYSFTVMAIDNTVSPADGSRTATATVMITVVEKTNRVPTLTPSSATISVPESTFGSITTVTLTDTEDKGGFAMNELCIASGNVQDAFFITRSGEIHVNIGLDFESQPAIFNLTVMAYDETENPAWQSVGVTINLVDVNDVAPMFTTASYTAVVAEDAPEGTPVIRVHANDLDTGESGEIEYSLQSPPSVFSIDIQTGLISTTAVSLNRESFDSYTLTVVATDKGILSRSSQSSVNVLVLDVNDVTPSFVTLNTQVTFLEDRSIGSVIFTLMAEDADSGNNGQVKYSILSGNDNFLFHLNPWTGDVTLAKEIDFEDDSRTYTITFQVEDLGSPDALIGASLTKTIIVEDVNDNYPIFTSQLYECSILEGNSGTFNPACEVSAVDADAIGNAIQYTLLDASVPFTMTGGVITRDGTIDREINSHFILQVQAQDSGNPPKSSVTLVRISVTDVNDQVPNFGTRDTLYIPEELPLNTLLFFAHASDLDSDPAFSDVSYSLQEDTTDFVIDAVSGAVFLRTRLDYESKQSHFVGVIASTPSQTQASFRFTLNLIDINENILPPIFQDSSNPSVVSVARDAPTDTRIATLSAEDPDAPLGASSITYYAVGGSGYGYFKINANTGEVTTDFSLRSIEEASVTLEVIAFDGGPYPLSTQTVLNIELTSATDSAPYFVETVFVADVMQTIDIDHIIITVRAEVDGYHDPTVCYSISDGNGPGYFAINTSTGAISSTVGPGQFQEGETYRLTVSASKPNVLGNSSALVLITFSTANTFTPEFRPGGYDLFLIDTYPVDSSMPFVRVFARDDNLGENGRLTYSLQNEDALPFGISSTNGDMYLTESLAGTSTQTSQHTVTVMVADNGEQVRSSSVTITITVVDEASSTDTAPAFSQPSNLGVGEDAGINFMPLTRINSVNDISHTLMYRIQEQPEEFTISPNTGDIYLTGSLDFEIQPIYDLTIEIWDGFESHTRTVNIRINVININDNRPEFSSPVFLGSVMEHSSNGELVTIVTAADEDVLGSLTYTLIDSLPPVSAQLFTLSPDGTLTVNGDIDREAYPVHLLTVAAEDSDGLLDYARVMVTVIDTNDHLPLFPFPLPEIWVREDSTNASVVHTVTTFDPDTGDNTQNVYRLESNDAPFVILATTGELVLTDSLDAEMQSHYDLVVISENINDRDTSMTSLRVNIVDVLDSTPVFPDLNSVSVQENLPAYSTVASFYVSSNTRPVYYSIVGGNELGRFFIEPLTGILRTSLPLDREEQSEYDLMIRGSFGEGFDTDLSVTVLVGDDNDNPPQFPSEFLEYDISESEPLSTVHALNISDPDEGTNAELSSCLVEGNTAAEYFTVNTDGDLRRLKSLNRDNFESIWFKVYCFDSGTPVQYSSAQIRVNVMDSNNNIPQFEQSSYTFTISTPILTDVPQFTLTAIDNDLGIFGTVRYSIVGGTGLSKFAIASTTGEVSVSNNYGLQPRYDLIVEATDGEWTASVTVEVLVKECGFQQLQIRPDFIHVEIMESIPINSIIIRPERFDLLEFGQPPSSYEYSITESLFGVDEDSGQVFVSAELDRENREVYQLVLQARDRNDLGRIAQADIEIILLDDNDNPPRFLLDEYVAFVRNNETAGYLVIRVLATDIDEGQNAEITYSIVEDPSGVFQIDEVTGQISLSLSIDNIQLDSIVTLSVLARDSGVVPLDNTVSVEVHIVDSNAPRFTMERYNASIYENAGAGATVITVQALSVTSDIIYRLEETSFPFDIGHDDGVVRVRDPGLDYESRSFYALTLIAEDDSTDNVLLGRARLEITVLDVNDNPPIFEDIDDVQVYENATTPFIVLEVSATDLDSPPNAGITYTIEGNVFADKFAVDETSGAISIISNLDYEEMPAYRFNVLAIDSGLPQQTGSVSVGIGLVNVNDNPPVFTQSLYTVTVPETASPGTSLFLFVVAEDADGDDLGSLSYSIVPNIPGHDNFGVTSDGLLFLNPQSVNLTEPEYLLNVSAFDGLFYGYATVEVQVLDINDHSPVFNQSVYSASITENNVVGQFITQVFATDADQGINAEITYSLTSTADAFQIDAQTGVITARVSIDRESMPSISFDVVGRDGGGRRGMARVNVAIEDVNDNAPIFSPVEYEGTAIEGSLTDTLVVSVTATDSDSGDNGRIVYAIPGTDNQFPFEIDSTNGDITIGPLGVDPDIQDEYNFTVTATDSGIEPMAAETQAVVIVYVVAGTDESPVFTNPDYARVSENAQVNHEIIELTSTTCSDMVNPFFELTFDESMSFGLRNINQLVVARAPLVVGNYTVQLRARCVFTGLRGTQLLTVEVVDLNSPPELVVRGMEAFQYFSSVPESTPISTELSIDAFVSSGRINNVVIEAQDEDEGINGTFTFRLRDNPAEFAIDSTSGVITVNGLLDYDLGLQTYSFFVEVVDGGDPPLTDSTNLLVRIVDVNDIPPRFISDMFIIEVPEDIQPGESFFRIQAIDNDTLPENKMIMYRVSGGSFTVDNSSGDISALHPLDRETTPRYDSIIVIASDGVGTDVTEVVIIVTDVNDEPPVFNQTQYSVTLDENYPAGVTFLQVFTTDADEDENAQASYIITEQQSDIVTINNATGEISFLTPPDYEFSPRLELTVRALDVGDPSLLNDVTVVITLNDLNDERPVFMEQVYSAEIMENRPAGTSVRRVEAIDDDSGLNGVVSYSIAGEEGELFNITNGVIRTKRPFDREANATFEITVIATDSGLPPLSSNVTVSVTILDENDEQPVFDMTIYTAQVSEFQPSGFTFLTVMAEDRDEGINARVSYRLSGTNVNDFQIQTNENGIGILSLRNQLNYERVNMYNLSIRANDDGFPSMESTAILLVEVLDENDNPPVFEEFSYEMSIREDTPMGSIILSIRATDRDVSDVLVYDIQNIARFPELFINSTSGSIHIASSLNYESIQQYNLVGIARDQTATPMSATVDVTITVIDVNDNPPHFRPHNDIQFITENNQPGQTVFTLEADDQDSASVSQPGLRTFAIESGNTGDAFDIDDLTGRVLATQVLDREEIASYFLNISVEDNGDPSLTGFTTITVIVEDVNDNRPTGGHQDVYLYLYNGEAPLIATLGQVYVNDSDIVNQHTYRVLENPSNSLRVREDGSIEISSETPASSTIVVEIQDGPNGAATTTISSVIRNITAESLVNSFSMQLSSITPQHFVDNMLGSFLSIASSILMSDLPGPVSVDLQVFSIQESLTSSGNLDVFILVEDTENGGFVHPTLVQHVLHINRHVLEAALEVNIVTEFVDLCSSESCSPGLLCSNTFQYSSTESVSFGSRSISYLGLSIQHSFHCQPIQPSPCDTLTGCDEPAYCLETDFTAVCLDSCDSNPCKNGGTCQSLFPGYYCMCPDGFDGRNCELTGATFTGSSYAIFPSIDKQQSGTISLEVITEEENGLLFYVGRFDSLYNDFIALELVNGRPSVILSYGEAGSMMLESSDVIVSDLVPYWHKLDINYTPTSVTLTVTTYDPFTVRRSSVSITGDFRYLDLGGPLIFGRLPLTFNYKADSKQFQSFTGCMRNVRINGKLIDFSETLDEVNLGSSCVNEDRQCNDNPCNNNGRCVGVWENFYCDCTSSYAGAVCAQVSGTATFSGENLIHYEIKTTSDVRPLRQTSSSNYTVAQNEIRLSLATGQSSGTVLQLGETSQEYLILEIVDDRLQLRYNLGSGEATLRQSTVKVSNEEFHEVFVTRTEREAEIVIDGMYYSRVVSPGTEVTLDIAANSMYLGASIHPVNRTVINGLTGCVSGLRLNRQDVPIGGENEKFITLEISDDITSGCPIGNLFETPQPDMYVYAGIIVILAVLLLTSAGFVLVCMLSRWIRRRRTGIHRVNLRRDSSRRSWNFQSPRSGSPPQDGFQWQSASTYKYNMGSPPGEYRSTPQHTSDPAFNFNMNNRSSSGNSPTPDFPVTNVAETGFNAPSHRSSSRNAQRLRIPQPREGFSFSQSNQGYRDDVDLGGPTATDLEAPPPRHLRSFSGQQSILSASTIATSSLHDDTEDTSLGKRLDIANSEIRELYVDEMRHYKDEGPYEPLGSVGSLLDFVKELDQDNFKVQAHETPVESQVERLPKHKSRPRMKQKSVSREPPVTYETKTSPLTGERYVDSEEPKDKPVKLREGRSQAQKHIRSSKRNSHSKRMENILERFHNITTGYQPDEGRLI